MGYAKVNRLTGQKGAAACFHSDFIFTHLPAAKQGQYPPAFDTLVFPLFPSDLWPPAI
jgi:hypothetical protein